MRFTKTNLAILSLVFIVSFFIALNYCSYMTIEFDARVVKGKDFKGQVYYSDNGVFSEKDAIYFNYRRTRGWQHVDLELRNVKNITALRLDPIMGDSGIVDIKNIKLKGAKSEFFLEMDGLNKAGSHSLEIKYLKKKEALRLTITGEDPYVFLADGLKIETIGYKTYFNSLLLSFVFTFILVSIYHGVMKYRNIDHIILSISILLYTFFTLFFHADSRLVLDLFIILPLLSLFVLFRNNIFNYTSFFKIAGIFYVFYFLTAFSITYFFGSKFSDSVYLKHVFYYIFLSLILAAGFFHVKNFNIKYFRIFSVLLVLSATLIIVFMDNKIISFSGLKFFEYEMAHIGWVQKNYGIWLVLLTWWSISFYSYKKTKEFLIAIIVLFCSYFALSEMSYDSAFLSLLVGIVVYLVFIFLRNANKKFFYIFALLVSLYIFFTPVLFNVLEPYWKGYIPARVEIYRTAIDLIAKSWLVGYGFSSVDSVSPALRGHPHNLSMLFWLEFGVWGALFLAATVFILFKKLIDKTYGHPSQTALLALFISLLVFTSFSWSYYFLAMIFTYAFALALTLLSLNQVSFGDRKDYPKECKSGSGHSNEVDNIMNSVAIEAKNITKIYHLYDNPSDRLKESLSISKKQYHHDYYALHNVSLEIKKGESVGIVGKNGAGKSTLLKIITGVLTSTGGELIASGKISSLLELGAGFNPEMTGYENIYLNGSIMGYTKEEVDAKVASIIEFADIGEFIYQPVKTYSSGMFARLAFAVAINVDPDILIVDEALSVGDAAFQRKCFAKLEDFRKRGKTILFVSHSERQIVELCSRAVLIHDGQIIIDGNPKKVTSLYSKMINASTVNVEEIRREFYTSKHDNEDTQDALNQTEQSNEEFEEFFDPSLLPSTTVEYDSDRARISDVKITTLDGQKVNVLKMGSDYVYTYEVHFFEDVCDVDFGMMFKSISGVELGATSSHVKNNKIKNIQKGQRCRVEYLFHNIFLPGVYFTNAGCQSYDPKNYRFLARLIDCYSFRVVEPEKSREYGGYVQFVKEIKADLHA